MKFWVAGGTTSHSQWSCLWHLFVPPWHQGLYPNIKEIGVKCLARSWWLLPVGICHKVSVSQELLKDVNLFGWELIDHPAYSSYPTASELHLFGHLKKHLAGRWFAADTDVEQAVTSRLQWLDISVIYARIQVLMPWWNRYVTVNHVEIWCVLSAVQHVYIGKKKKVKFALEQATKALRGSRCIVVLLL